jgi:roundabout, axon guidance receptor 2
MSIASLFSNPIVTGLPISSCTRKRIIRCRLLAAVLDSSSRLPLPTYDLAVVTEKLTSMPLVSIQQTRAVSSTSVRIVWEVRRHHRYIEGFVIKYRPLATAPGSDALASESGSTVKQQQQQQQQQQAGGEVVSWSAEERVADSSATSHVIQNMQKYTTYEFVMQPYYQTVVGLESAPTRVRTLEDGRQTRLH